MTWRQHRYSQALVALVSSTAWLSSSRDERLAQLAAGGWAAHVYTSALAQKGGELAAMYRRQRARGLPVPGWWRG